MANLTLGEVCDGINTTLGAAVGIETSESYDELRDDVMPDVCPILQVYPEEGDCNPGATTERTVFSGAIRLKVVSIHADIMTSARTFLDQDMKALTDVTDAIIEVLEEQNDPPFFGVVGLKAFTWRFKRGVFRRGDADFMGVRFVIQCRIF